MSALPAWRAAWLRAFPRCSRPFGSRRQLSQILEAEAFTSPLIRFIAIDPIMSGRDELRAAPFHGWAASPIGLHACRRTAASQTSAFASDAGVC